MSILEIITTTDGSHTLKNSELNEHYHSVHGAIQESQWVFIKAGLEVIASKSTQINLFEVGMGTGLNVLLSLKYCDDNEYVKINYTAVEPFLLPESITSQLNFCKSEYLNSYQNEFDLIHSIPPNSEIAFTDRFSLKKLNTPIQDFATETKYHLVYFDAFAPDIQPDLWTEEVFTKIREMMVSEGILVTYSCKGIVKRALRNAGFKVERIQGPPGKRQILRAIKKTDI